MVGEQMKNRLKEGTMVWLSTCGTGVYWLHMRMDPSPKYYSYRPYKSKTYQGSWQGGDEGRDQVSYQKDSKSSTKKSGKRPSEHGSKGSAEKVPKTDQKTS